MTVGRINAPERFKTNEKEIAEKMIAIQWEYNPDEIALYGVDSTKTPEYQEKILTVPLK